ncbi:hypothetical protein FGO68_gene10801 [Halteria grandinella]|uniref:Uncharacterized protein n=1 Tax=Halteria grandinella TaxID=5974 RepID=A0A8J8NY91_HALGN|nr:hypothetical protein FGO68_gene10801 [Halteria grandinella]
MKQVEVGLFYLKQLSRQLFLVELIVNSLVLFPEQLCSLSTLYHLFTYFSKHSLIFISLILQIFIISFQLLYFRLGTTCLVSECFNLVLQTPNNCISHFQIL